jgi:hypothetical protein
MPTPTTKENTAEEIISPSWSQVFPEGFLLWRPSCAILERLEIQYKTDLDKSF